MISGQLVASDGRSSTSLAPRGGGGIVELHADADLIEAVLSHYQVDARIEGGLLGPRSVRFHLRVGGRPEATLACIEALMPEIARLLGGRECRLRRRGEAVFLELARDLPPPDAIFFADLKALAGDPGPDTVLLGLAKDGRPLLWRLCSPTVSHMLVYGAPGSGKTVLLQGVGLSLAEAHPPRAWRLTLLDGRGGLGVLAALPHTWGHGGSFEGSIGWLVRLATELERRLEERRRAAAGEPLPRVLVLIDDVAGLLEHGGPTARLALARLLALGPDAGFHVAAATANPEILSLLAPAFPLRLAGSRPGGGELRPGEFCPVEGSEPICFRGPWVTLRDVALAVNRRHRHHARVAARRAGVKSSNAVQVMRS